MSSFNELTRVQIPAMIHLTRLGYRYLGKPGLNPEPVHDPSTNIIVSDFEHQFKKLNSTSTLNCRSVLDDIRKELDDDDLGRQFYQRLTAASPKLIDFEHPDQNDFAFTAEFSCRNGDEEFRPDITLFINGLPLVFIEVKKPNNDGGMLAECRRMNDKRFPNRKFRRFINITQLMLFSNNMEYDARGGIRPIEGVFYCTAARKTAAFNCFREENPRREAVAPFYRDYPYAEINPAVEKWILMDHNVAMIKDHEEYLTNCDIHTPTNRVLTSMVSPERLLYLLRYGIAYLHVEKEREDGTIESRDEKHIMRYQQFFASRIIREKIDQGTRSGIVWHTQGSGKTALSYHLCKVLKDYFAAQHQVAKFYFIVDRLDLLTQSSDEFEARGLNVNKVNSKETLMRQFRSLQSLEGSSGKDEITVVNIQKFDENKHIVSGGVSMPSNVFANTGTNVSVLFFDKSARKTDDDKVVLVDASKLGQEYKDANGLKKVRLENDEIEKIVSTFRNATPIEDFSVVVSYSDVKAKGYSLSAGQYFDIKIDYVDISADEFNAQMKADMDELESMFAESHRLEDEIRKQLKGLKFNG